MNTVSTTSPAISKKAVVALLRGVNVGMSNPLQMGKLRGICGSLGLEDTVTYLQSGNAIFRTKDIDLAEIHKELETTIKAECGFESAIVLRTVAELEAIVAANPFAGRADINPGRLVVTFLFQDPGDAGRAAVPSVETYGEEVFALGRELYIYYVHGQGKTKLKERHLNKVLGTTGTSRNWNTVTGVLELARNLEAGVISPPK